MRRNDEGALNHMKSNHPIGTKVRFRKEGNNCQYGSCVHLLLEYRVIELDDISDATFATYNDSAAASTVVNDLISLDLHDYTPIDLEAPADETPTASETTPHAVHREESLIEPLRVESPLGM